MITLHTVPPRPTWVSNATNDIDGDGCRDLDEDLNDDGDDYPDAEDTCPSEAGTSSLEISEAVLMMTWTDGQTQSMTALKPPVILPQITQMLVLMPTVILGLILRILSQMMHRNGWIQTVMDMVIT